MKYINKNLSIEKVNVQEIAKKFGTPTYCYSHKQLTENIKNFKKNFSSFSPLICFAVKSNEILNNSIAILNEVLKNLKPNKKKMLDLANSGYITATDLADYLVKNHSIPFRKAYQTTASIVNYAEKKKKKLNELNIDELKIIEPRLTIEVLKIFNVKNSVNSKKSYGGTSFDNIKKMIMKYKKA